MRSSLVRMTGGFLVSSEQQEDTGYAIVWIAVLLIYDILVWIRIRIRFRTRGSMPLTNRSGFWSGSCYFRYWPLRRQQKTKSFSVYYFLKLHSHHFLKIKILKSHKWSFLYYFCLMIEGSGSIPLTNGSGSGSRRPKNIRIRNTSGWGCFFPDLYSNLDGKKVI